MRKRKRSGANQKIEMVKMRIMMEIRVIISFLRSITLKSEERIMMKKASTTRILTEWMSNLKRKVGLLLVLQLLRSIKMMVLFC